MCSLFGWLCGKRKKRRASGERPEAALIADDEASGIKVISKKALITKNRQQSFINGAGSTFFIPAMAVTSLDVLNAQGSISIPRPILLTIKLASVPVVTLASGLIKVSAEAYCCCCPEEHSPTHHQLKKRVRHYLIKKRAVQISFAAWLLSVLIESVPSLVELSDTKPIYSQVADAGLAVVEFIAWMCLEKCLTGLEVSNEAVGAYIKENYPSYEAEHDAEEDHCPTCGQPIREGYTAPAAVLA